VRDVRQIGIGEMKNENVVDLMNDQKQYVLPLHYQPYQQQVHLHDQEQLRGLHDRVMLNLEYIQKRVLTLRKTLE
jgi:hypothetical protein